jgi:hypothetical protein
MTTQLELTRDIGKAEINNSMNIGPPPKCMNRVLNPRSWFERPSFILLALLGSLLHLWLLWGAANSVMKITCMHKAEKHTTEIKTKAEGGTADL